MTATDVQAKEAQFHDDRLLDESDREDQSKFYWSVERYHHQFSQDIERNATGKDVLELGCFAGDRTAELAKVAKSIVGIDISPLAVEKTLEKARQLNLENVSANVCDVENLKFDDQSFDLVFAEGVIHHVAVEGTMDEIFRVLRPGGVAMFREPLGQNPMINLYRSLTPSVRTDDEHPLMTADLDLMNVKFDRMDVDYFGFLSLGVSPLRSTAIGSFMRGACNSLDEMLFNNRLLGRFCWQANIVLRKDP